MRVITNAKKNEVTKEVDVYKVRLVAPPIQGKANRSLIEVLAAYFNVKKSAIKILRGEKSKNKLVGIDIKDENKNI